MLIGGLRSVLFFCLFISVVSCQKELDENGYESCFTSKIEVFHGNAAVPSEIYGYLYNPVSMQFSALHIDIPALGYSRRAVVSVSGNKIRVEGLGLIELDGSRRITHLETLGEFPGSRSGDYFYGYNISGFLEERLFDDGLQVLERTVFANDGTGFTSFHKTNEGSPVTAKGEFFWGRESSVTPNALLPYGDVFPELVPFFPMFRLGKISPLPLERVTEIMEAPTYPALAVGYQYEAYSASGTGALQSFESKKQVDGQPAHTRKYRITYTCQ